MQPITPNCLKNRKLTFTEGLLYTTLCSTALIFNTAITMLKWVWFPPILLVRKAMLTEVSLLPRSQRQKVAKLGCRSSLLDSRACAYTLESCRPKPESKSSSVPGGACCHFRNPGVAEEGKGRRQQIPPSFFLSRRKEVLLEGLSLVYQQ